MPLALATWPPARFNPLAKVDPRLLRSTPGQLPKPRRAGVRIGMLCTAGHVDQIAFHLVELFG